MSKRVNSLATMHPAAIMRGQWAWAPSQRRALARVGRYLRGEEQYEPIDVTQPPPNCNLYPSVEEIEEFCYGLPNTSPEGVSHDLESAGPHPRCDGVCRVSDLHYICIRFRKQGGALWWPRLSELSRVVKAWWFSLTTVPLYFHNGQAYDLHEYTAAGLPFEEMLAAFARGGDTMVAQREAFGEQPAGLQHCAINYLGVPAWKHLTQEDDEGAEGK